MRRLGNVLYCYVLVVSSVCAVPAISLGTEEVFVIYDDEIEMTDSTQPILKMSPECETPNHDTGYCMGILNCSKLLEQVKKQTAIEFLRESKCGPANEDIRNPKVCCGKYNDYITNIEAKKQRNILPKHCGKQRIIVDQRIYGGSEAGLGEYPWMAILVHESKYGMKTVGCMGFLVHSRYVITAAHCTHPSHLSNRGPIVYAVLGEHDLKNKTDCSSEELVCALPRQLSTVSTVVTHPDYDPKDPAHLNDIAIIRLKNKARLTDFVQPICLMSNDAEILTQYSLSGWGRTEKAAKSNVKLRVTVPSYNKAECERKYSATGIHLKETQICAGGESRKDSCTGDSGGPLMMRAENGTWYATGVVSFGIGCGQEGWPGVYTNIVKFLPWIKSQIADTQKN